MNENEIIIFFSVFTSILIIFIFFLYYQLVRFKDLKDRLLVQLTNLQLDIDNKSKMITDYSEENKELRYKLEKFTNRPDTYDALELLHDLSQGRAFIEVKRIAPGNFFLKRPTNE